MTMDDILSKVEHQLIRAQAETTRELKAGRVDVAEWAAVSEHLSRAAHSMYRGRRALKRLAKRINLVGADHSDINARRAKV